MSKPYCKMTIKELLEFLNACDEAAESPNGANRPRIQYFNGGINGSLGARIDEETLKLVLKTGGIHPLSDN